MGIYEGWAGNTTVQRTKMKQEIWKSIEGFEKYQVSNYGRILNKYKRIGKPKKLNHGHLIIALRKNGKYHNFLVHRLVAHNFIGPCPMGKEINHKDFNKTNNQVSNLEYLTHSENAIHTFKHDPPKFVKLNEQAVKVIKYFLSKRYTCQKLANVYGVAKPTIMDIRHKRHWKWVI